MTRERQRRGPQQRTAAPEAPTTAPTGPGQGILALQRSAGNAATVQSLGGAGPVLSPDDLLRSLAPVVQREETAVKEKVDTWPGEVAGQLGITVENATTLGKVRDGGWSPEQAKALATAFKADAGGRSAAVWADLAQAHASVKEQPAAVAAVARAGWSKEELAGFATTFVAIGAGVAALVATPDVATDLHALNGTFTPAGMGTFVGRLNVKASGNIAAFVHEGGAKAGMSAMTAASWPLNNLALMTADALLTGVAPGSLVTLMATAGFAAAAAGMVQKSGWPEGNVGTLVGKALLAGATPEKVKAQVTTAGMPDAMKDTVLTGGVGTGDVGTFMGAAGAAGAPEAFLLGLQKLKTFGTGVKGMTTAGWTPATLGQFTAGFAGQDNKPGDMEPLLRQGAYAANSQAFVTAGFSATEVGQISGKAMITGLTAANLQGFMATASAATNCFSVKAWGAADLGLTIATVLNAAGAPKAAQLVSLLDECAKGLTRGGPIKATAAGLRTAATAGPAPKWADVITNLPTWRTNYVGAAPADSGGTLASATFAGGLKGGGYNVVLSVTDWIRHHVDARHIVEHTDFSPATCLRNAGGGHALTFYSLGTKADKHVKALAKDGTVQACADSSAWYGFDTCFPGSDKVGTNKDGAPYTPKGKPKTYPTAVTQCYPTGGGISVKGPDLLAIGRILL